MNKQYDFVIGDVSYRVRAEEQGVCRYMVRMTGVQIGTRQDWLRIGYLTGKGSQWVAEAGQGAPGLPFASAKAACKDLLENCLSKAASSGQQGKKRAASAKMPCFPSNPA